MGKNLKLIFIAVLVVIVLLVIIGTLGANKDRIQGYFENKRAQATYDQMVAEKNALEEKKKDDFAGGKTPEETIEMYLKALKDSNIDKANSFYAVGVKESDKDKLLQVPLIIKNTEKLFIYGEKKCGITLYKLNYCSWSIKDDSGVLMTFDLEQNPYTKIWKIVY